jgi:DNA transformation protein
MSAHAPAVPVPIGPASRAMLAAAGIHTLEQLQDTGAVRAYLRVEAAGRKPSLNLLWALEAVLSGRNWQTVAREDRLRLLCELEDQALMRSPNNPAPVRSQNGPA